MSVILVACIVIIATNAMSESWCLLRAGQGLTGVSVSSCWIARTSLDASSLAEDCVTYHLQARRQCLA